MFWRNAQGLAETKNGGKVKYGLGKGTADLVGFCRPSGRFIALEVKTAVGRASDEQKAFIAMVNLGGGYGRFVRSVGDANEAVDAAIEGAKA